MNSSDLNFELPDWKVLPPRPNQISLDAWLDWLEANRLEFLRTGQMQKIWNDPLRCPVNVRFKW
jgi:hypothetical protein